MGVVTAGIPLELYSTLKTPAWADGLEVLASPEDVARFAARVPTESPTITILGEGSNVVLLDRVPGTLCLMRTRGMSFAPDSRGRSEVTIAAGEHWHDVVRATLGRGWYGLENLALIPGSVGAAPIQNIGAYGVELQDRFKRLSALDLQQGCRVEFDRAACEFAYRHSVFKTPEAKGRFLILDVTLVLSRCSRLRLDYPDIVAELSRLGRSKPSPVDVAEAVVRVRRRKLPDPRHVANVGSFFKNPLVPKDHLERLRHDWPQLQGRVQPDPHANTVKLSAAQLIDVCGWKSRPSAFVAVWPRQPLVLINRGGASGRDFLEYSEAIRRDVRQRFNLDLELEPTVIGK